jgi:hypothetical protein
MMPIQAKVDIAGRWDIDGERNALGQREDVAAGGQRNGKEVALADLG